MDPVRKPLSWWMRGSQIWAVLAVCGNVRRGVIAAWGRAVVGVAALSRSQAQRQEGQVGLPRRAAVRS